MPAPAQSGFFLNTEAIVLHSRLHGEVDKLLSLLTRRAGRVRAVAKGGARSKKRFMNCLDPLGRVWISVEDRGRDLVRLDSCRLIARPGLAADPFRFGLAGLAVEVCDVFCPESEPMETVYHALAAVLAGLAGHDRPLDLTLAFCLRLLHESGFGPTVDGCLICGRPADKGQGFSLDPEAGGLICTSCRDDSRPLSRGAVRTIRLCQTMAPSALGRIRFPRAETAVVFNLVGHTLAHVAGREIKSLAFVRETAPRSQTGRTSRHA